MKKFESVDELLDFAIKEEEDAASFYKELAGKMDRAWMKEIFEQFSREEEGHKAKLLKVKSGEMPKPPQQKVLDLKIGDYLVDTKLTADMDYQQALIVAMKKEKAAFRMYSDLASVADNDALRDMLLGLAQEEAKHKLRFEVEYDDVILKEN
jgi:rubrerythrin